MDISGLLRLFIKIYKEFVTNTDVFKHLIWALRIDKMMSKPL